MGVFSTYRKIYLGNEIKVWSSQNSLQSGHSSMNQRRDFSHVIAVSEANTIPYE